MAIDYRAVNRHTQQDHYGLHRPEDILQRIGKARIFSKLDLRQGFLQIGITPEDQPKTAYWCENQLKMYTRMPYGLKNAPAKFQRVMDYEIAKANLTGCAISFIDDVLIWSNSPEQHIQDVSRVLDMLHSCGLRAHPDKSIFGADVIEYLGHNLSASGISPCEAKVSSILALTAPKNVSELRSLLGFVNYYRCYVPNMSSIAQPLNELLKKDAPWRWGPEHQAALDNIKSVFTREGIVLRRIDYSKPFILHTDWSKNGMGAILGQCDDDGNEYMCACISRSLNKHEKNYHPYKGELAAVTWAVKSFRHHLQGGPRFKLVTDHQPLSYLMASDTLSGQYARYALILQDFDFEIVHRPGVRHQNADFLSRQPLPSTADTTGQRLEEDPSPEEQSRCVMAALSQARSDHVLLQLTYTSQHLAAFSSTLCSAKDDWLSGHLGLPTDYMDAPWEDDTSPLDLSLRRLKKQSRELVRATKLPESCTGPCSRAFARGYSSGLTVYEPVGTLCTGVEACLRNGYRVERYLAHATDADEVALITRRLGYLSATYPALFPVDSWRGCWSALPHNLSEVTEASLLSADACLGTQWLVCANLSWPNTSTDTHASHVLRVLKLLSAMQRKPAAFLIEAEHVPNTSYVSFYDDVIRALGLPACVDASRLGSMVHRRTCYWTNITTQPALLAAFQATSRESPLDAATILEPDRSLRVPLPSEDAPSDKLFPILSSNLHVVYDNATGKVGPPTLSELSRAKGLPLIQSKPPCLMPQCNASLCLHLMPTQRPPPCPS